MAFMREVRSEHERGLATITLVDPGGRNMLGPRPLAELRAAVEAADRDRQVGAILLRAEALSFCAGGDIGWFAAQAEDVHDGIRGLSQDGAEAIRVLHETPKITVAAVHGAAAGSGLGVALACDLVVAAHDATFVTAYARIGASPDLGVSAFLVRELGYRRALELCVLSGSLTAREALELGLVSRVVDRHELDAAALALARRIADGPHAAQATTKRLLRQAGRRELAEHLRDELASVADLGRTADWQEGIAAFQERREPRFGAGGRDDGSGAGGVSPAATGAGRAPRA